MDAKAHDGKIFAYRNALKWAKQLSFARGSEERGEAAAKCMEQIKKMLPPMQLVKKK